MDPEVVIATARRRAGLVLGVLAAALAACAAPASAQGVDETCALALTKVDAATVNVAYPDEGALYYGGDYAAAPGTEIVIHGAYPHARYISYNVYDAALRPIDSLSDLQLVPDKGSTNPFVAGADRDVTQRSYTARIVFTAAPAVRAPNTMYVDPAVSPGGTFLYRIYLPDRGRDATGDVGLPTVTVVPAGGDETATSPCAGVEKPSVTGINEALAKTSTPVNPPARTPDPPVWRKFVNFASAIAVNATGSPSVGGADLDTAGGSGGFLSNRDNAYVGTQIERGNGLVSVTRVTAPTFPDTRPGTKTMPGGQVRYWSMCENDPFTQRFVACTPDDQVVLGKAGVATFVVSTPEDRPANAVARCGVNWLPWGTNPRGLLILRHMLPSPGFTQSVQNAKPDHEAQTMGGYFPVSRYYADAGAFEKLGCADAAAPVAVATPVSGRVCLSRRLIAVTVPRRVRHVRSASVQIGARHAHRVLIHRRRVVVDLRGLPRGRLPVRISFGRHVALHRAYRTCVAS